MKLSQNQNQCKFNRPSTTEGNPVDLTQNKSVAVRINSINYSLPNMSRVQRAKGGHLECKTSYLRISVRGRSQLVVG